MDGYHHICKSEKRQLLRQRSVQVPIAAYGDLRATILEVFLEGVFRLTGEASTHGFGWRRGWVLQRPMDGWVNGGGWVMQRTMVCVGVRGRGGRGGGEYIG